MKATAAPDMYSVWMHFPGNSRSRLISIPFLIHPSLQLSPSHRVHLHFCNIIPPPPYSHLHCTTLNLCTTLPLEIASGRSFFSLITGLTEVLGISEMAPLLSSFCTSLIPSNRTPTRSPCSTGMYRSTLVLYAAQSATRPAWQTSTRQTIGTQELLTVKDLGRCHP